MHILRPSFVRNLSTSRSVLSHVGLAPIILPPGVELTVRSKVLDEVTALRMRLDAARNGKPRINLTKELRVAGPKGELTLDLAEFVDVEVANGKAKVSVADAAIRAQHQMWGTTRALVNNCVNGVVEGHMCIVKFVGTGYRAILEQGTDGPRLALRVGYCVPMYVDVPADIKVTVPVPHRIIIEGVDKQRVTQLAAKIRRFRPPEPYKGKGIFVDSETIKIKTRKIK